MCFLLVKSDISDYSGKVESFFGADTKKGVEETIRLLERAVGMRDTNSLTSAATVQYNITENSIINEDAILDTLHEEGEASDGKKGENSGGVSGVSSEYRDSRGSNTEDKRNISVADSEVESDSIDTVGNKYRKDSKRSDGNSLGGSVQSSAFEIQTGREGTDGRRFYDALKNGDEKTARKLLNEQAEPYLKYINSIAEKAILLDSEAIPEEKAKSENSVMMHSLYAVADIGNGRELLKLYVEELNDVNSDGTISRAYQLQNIENQQLKSSEFKQSFSSINSTADINTVSDLFEVVKIKDKNFKPNPTSLILNEDGTPKVVYHGSSENFEAFDITKSRSWEGTPDYDLPGFYFSESTEESGGYGDIKPYDQFKRRCKYWQRFI